MLKYRSQVQGVGNPGGEREVLWEMDGCVVGTRFRGEALKASLERSEHPTAERSKGWTLCIEKVHGAAVERRFGIGREETGQGKKT